MTDLVDIVRWHTTRAAVSARLDSFSRYLPVTPVRTEAAVIGGREGWHATGLTLAG